MTDDLICWKNVDTNYNWTVSVQYVFWNVLLIHQIGRISTYNRPRNTDMVSHLKWTKILTPSSVYTQFLYLCEFFCALSNGNFSCRLYDIHQHRNDELFFALRRNLLSFFHPHCYYCCCDVRKMLDYFVLQLSCNHY